MRNSRIGRAIGPPTGCGFAARNVDPEGDGACDRPGHRLQDRDRPGRRWLRARRRLPVTGQVTRAGLLGPATACPVGAYRRVPAPRPGAAVVRARPVLHRHPGGGHLRPAAPVHLRHRVHGTAVGGGRRSAPHRRSEAEQGARRAPGANSVRGRQWDPPGAPPGGSRLVRRGVAQGGQHGHDNRADDDTEDVGPAEPLQPAVGWYELMTYRASSSMEFLSQSKAIRRGCPSAAYSASAVSALSRRACCSVFNSSPIVGT